ncbi:MAG: drug/metabolite exporter YedA [Deltaproteobacteria bacterium]|nr:drug/metabolite exporter YedA [Deltaproteobacteria bacterium]
MKRMIAETSAPTATAPRIDPRLILSLVAVYVIWSSTYLAIRIAIVDLPPLLTASVRFVGAGLVLFLIAMRRGATWPTAREWLRVAPIGGLLFLGGNGLVSIAQQSVSSGGAAVVCAMMPVWMGVLGALSGEWPTRREWASLAIGFVGVFVLMGGPTLAGEPLHIAILVLSPMAWALGSILGRRLRGRAAEDSFMLPAMQMLTGGVILFAVAALRGERFPADAAASSWLAVGYLWLFGSILGFTAYSWLNRHARPVVATSYAYVNPVLAVILGAVISGEPLGVTTVVANVLIVGAVYLALRKPKR